MSWLDAMGWFGSALLIVSIMQARVLRFRVLNTAACLILTLFNALLGIWPMVAMNVALVAINTWFLVGLLREARAQTAYAVLPVAADDAYLRHFLSVEAAAIVRYFPDFSPALGPAHAAYLVLHGHETAGVVVVRDDGDGVARVELDYVTAKFRDFTPGAYLYRESGLFRDRGFTRVRTPEGMVKPYYDKLGFERVHDHYELTVSPG